MNYRKKFKEHYGIDFGEEYHIHHIDLNHENNDISNLLLLPSELHSKYHFALNNFNRSIQPVPTLIQFDATIGGNCVNVHSYTMNMLDDLISAIKECDKWYDYKMYLDGLAPNIHKIKL